MRPSCFFTQPHFAAYSRGFTAIEVLVVIAILGILAAVTAPPISHALARQQLRLSTDELRTALQLGRAEATRRRAFVSLIPTANGWELFLDANGDGTRDAAATEPLLHTRTLPPTLRLEVTDHFGTVIAPLNSTAAQPAAIRLGARGEVTAARTLRLTTNGSNAVTRTLCIQTLNGARVFDGQALCP